MKRIVALLLCACVVLGIPAMTACTPRESILKVYNWEDYMDPELITEFEDWYFEQTGKHIRVKYTTFTDNEEMLPKIRETHINYDVVCPSDYMIHRMKNMGLLKPLNLDLIEEAMQEPEDSDFYEEGVTASLSDLNPTTLTETEGDRYSVAFMCGTVGVLYNNTKISQAEAYTWASLFEPSATQADCRYKIYMKDSVRETVSIAALYDNRTALKALYDAGDTAAQQALVSRTINLLDEQGTHSQIDKLLSRYRTILLDQKDYIRGYENDLGKNEFVSGNNSVYLGIAWSGDALWCMFDTNDDGDIVGLNTDISFAVPYEGSNIWFDSWVIPKYAVNVDAANYFIGFMSRASSSYRNMDHIGYTSANEVAKEAYKQDLDADEGWLATDPDAMLFDTDGDGEISTAEQAYKDMLMDAMFPSPETAGRCAIYTDFGNENTKKLDNFWATLK